jgi:N-ethylmaleimide reductase
MTDHKALFSPTTFGHLKLKHRVIMTPLTRSRSIQPDSVPGDLMRE